MKAIVHDTYGSLNVLKLRDIDKTYTLRETPAALGYIEGGHARGKVVITV